MIDALRTEAVLAIDTERLVGCDHELDAVLCVIAGADFLRGECVAPTVEEREVAELEGWIWFRSSTTAHAGA